MKEKKKAQKWTEHPLMNFYFIPYNEEPENVFICLFAYVEGNRLADWLVGW